MCSPIVVYTKCIMYVCLSSGLMWYLNNCTDSLCVKSLTLKSYHKKRLAKHLATYSDHQGKGVYNILYCNSHSALFWSVNSLTSQSFVVPLLLYLCVYVCVCVCVCVRERESMSVCFLFLQLYVTVCFLINMKLNIFYLKASLF